MPGDRRSPTSHPIFALDPPLWGFGTPTCSNRPSFADRQQASTGGCACARARSCGDKVMRPIAGKLSWNEVLRRARREAMFMVSLGPPRHRKADRSEGLSTRRCTWSRRGFRAAICSTELERRGGPMSQREALFRMGAHRLRGGTRTCARDHSQGHQTR